MKSSDNIESPEARSPPSTTWLEQIVTVFRFAVQRGNAEKLLQVTSNPTVTTVLAVAPMLAIVLSLSTACPVFFLEFRKGLNDFLTKSQMPPAVSDNIMEHLNQFALQASRLTAIGNVFLVVTSIY